MSSESQPNLSKEVNSVFFAAAEYAHKSLHQFVTIDTIFYHLLNSKRTKEILEGVSIDVEEFKKNLEIHLDENIPKFKSHESYANNTPSGTLGLHNWLVEANQLQRANGKSEIDEDVLVVAVFSSILEDTYTLNFLESKEVNRQHVYDFLQNGNVRELDNGEGELNNNQTNNSKSPLKKYTVLLNNLAKDGKIDPIIGREKEIENVINVLAQRRKNNPILVGDAGVGKTAIAEGLALRIFEKNVPEQMLNYKIHSLDIGSLIAGTKYRGEFEDRLDKLIKEVIKDPNIVLFIDEIHTIVGAGASSGSIDAANLLKPALGNGSLKVMGSTTYDEYNKIIEKESALARRFQKIMVDEPSVDDTIGILKGLKSKYESFHGLTYTDEAIEASVKLSVKFLRDRKLPDKAIDLIDMAGAQIKLKKREDKTISEKDITKVLSKLVNIPSDEVEQTDKEKLLHLEENLNKKIFGQEKAITSVVDSILLSRAKLIRDNKPIGSFLMAGPTGVGKTELAKQVAENLDIPLIRFDMSEYGEKFNVSRLIGSPPGYVGSDDGGQLTDAIRKTPYCVLLLDEIEKAHPDVFNIFLQIMDDATLTDSKGKKADFKNVIVMMSSNAGASEISKNKIGFGSQEEEKIVNNNARTEVLRKSFKPEFLNRFDAIIQFNPLTVDIIEKVVEKQLNELQTLALNNKVVITYTPDVVKYLSEKGFDPKMGARPLQRCISDEIAKPLSRKMIFGNLENGGEIQIEVENGSIVLKNKNDVVKELLDKPSKVVRKKSSTKTEA